MYCTSCGNRLEDGDRFCGACGKGTGVDPQARAAPPPRRRLARAMDEKSIAGVCSGFARYLGVDIILVRIIWLTVAICTGIGFIAYFLAWIIMPKDYGRTAPYSQPATAAGPQPA